MVTSIGSSAASLAPPAPACLHTPLLYYALTLWNLVRSHSRVCASFAASGSRGSGTGGAEDLMPAVSAGFCGITRSVDGNPSDAAASNWSVNGGNAGRADGLVPLSAGACWLGMVPSALISASASLCPTFSASRADSSSFRALAACTRFEQLDAGRQKMVRYQ